MRDCRNGWILALILVGPHPLPKGMKDCRNGWILNLIHVVPHLWPKGMKDYWNEWILTLILIGPHPWPKRMGCCLNGGIFILIPVDLHLCPKGIGDYRNGRPKTSMVRAHERYGRHQQCTCSNGPRPSVMTIPKHPYRTMNPSRTMKGSASHQEISHKNR